MSNQVAIRYYCPVSKDAGDEVICRSIRCQYKYYFFVPFSRFWSDNVGWYNPMGWCIESVMEDMNK